MSYEIVRYHPRYRREVLQIETHLWSPDLTWNDAYLRWKYDENPYVKDPLLVLALNEGRVVGVRGAYGAQWQLGPSGERWGAPCLGDMVIAPAHRDRQLFTRLNEAVLDAAAAEGFRFAFNLSSSPVTHLSLRAMGFRSLGSLELVQRPGDRWRSESRRDTSGWTGRIRSLVDRIRRAQQRLPREPFGRFDDRSVARRDGASGAVTAAARPEPTEMAALIARIGGDARVRHVRDERYFRWRFGNPLAAYRFLYWRASQLEGYLVLRMAVHQEAGRTSIIDWEATNPGVANDLLDAALTWAGSEDLDIWSATLSPDRRGALRERGFESIKVPAKVSAWRPAVLIRALETTASGADWTVAGCSVSELQNWDLRMCYSDGY